MAVSSMLLTVLGSPSVIRTTSRWNSSRRPRKTSLPRSAVARQEAADRLMDFSAQHRVPAAARAMYSG